MARQPSASAAKAAANPRDYTSYADKAPTSLQERFTKWILEVTGYEPDDMDSFEAGVRLGVALRMAFQASPENQKVLEENKAKAAEKAAKPKAKKASKKPASVANPVEDADDEDADEEPEEVPVKRVPGKRAKREEPAEEAESDSDEDGSPF